MSSCRATNAKTADMLHEQGRTVEAAYHNGAAMVLYSGADAIEALPAAPVGYTQAIAVAEAVATARDMASQAQQRHDDASEDGCATDELREAALSTWREACDLRALVTRTLGTSAQVAEAERAYLDACYAVDAVIKEPTGAWAVASRAREDAWLALRRAREEASR